MMRQDVITKADFPAESLPAGRDGQYGLSVTEDWEGLAGTVYGGFTAAAMLRAAGEEATLECPVSMACQFLRPVRLGVPATINVERLRAGRRTEHLRVTLAQDEAVAVQANVVAVERGAGLELDPPTCPATIGDAPDHRPTAMERISAQGVVPPPDRLRMWRRLDWRVPSVDSDRIVPDAAEAGIGGWVNIDVGDEADAWLNAARTLVPADAAAPAPFDRVDRLAALRQGIDPLAPTSLDLVAHFHDWSARSPWLCFQIEAPVAGGGVGHTRSRVWSEDGNLLTTVFEQLLFVSRLG